MAKILVVEDDKDVLSTLGLLLRADHHTVDEVSDGTAAEGFISRFTYDLIMLDWELPGITGVDLLKSLRSKGCRTPVLMLTGRSATIDKIEGLDTGADGYLTKPFEAEVLRAAIRAILRRTPDTPNETLSFKDLELVPAQCMLKCGEKTAVLSSTEYEVARLLFENYNRILSPLEFSAKIWGESTESVGANVRTRLSRLRDKFTEVGSQVRIVGIKGFGYRLE